MSSISQCNLISSDRLREVLSYDPAVGVFVWCGARRSGVPHGSEAGSTDPRGYRQLRIDGKNYLGHRLAWFWVIGRWPLNQIDHINGDKRDNRFSNLRDVDQAVNMQNMKAASARSTTGLLGVSRFRDRWKSTIWVSGKNTHIGYFSTAQEAHAAYLDAKRIKHPGCTI